MQSFDQAFQEQLAAHYLRDDIFVSSVGALVLPEYFDNETLSAIIAINAAYLTRYQATCTLNTFVQVAKRAIDQKKVKVADMQEFQRLLGVVWRDPLANRQYVIDRIVEFARLKALSNGLLTLADALDTEDESKIGKALTNIEEAKAIGSVDAKVAHSYKRQLQDRLSHRAIMATSGMGGGITTGCKELDSQLLPWNGFGRKELSILMAPPKSGKTAGLIHFGKQAALAGKNVFYASCEVSEEIIGARLDSSISGIPFKQLNQRSVEVEANVEAWLRANPNQGEFEIQAFPVGTLKVSDLRRILKKYEAKGILFDMIIVDYGDIMCPETHHKDMRHGITEIFRGLRALASDFNAAVLTATQTNREGSKKAGKFVTDGTDVAEDYEKVRVADVLITINRSQMDKDNGEMVLYFSEMRNAESGLRMRYATDLSCMRFIVKFLAYDQ